MSKYFLAVDIGASSGRHILGSYENGKIEIRIRCDRNHADHHDGRGIGSDDRRQPRQG